MLALRIIISVGLLIYLLFFAIPKEKRYEILALFGSIKITWLAFAILLTFTDRIISAWKWLILLRTRERNLSPIPVLQIFFITTFLGYFLPSSIGGDALRIYSMGRLKNDLAGSASSVVIDRAYGTLGLLLIAALAVIPTAGKAISIVEASIIWAFTLLAFTGVIILSSRSAHRWMERVAKLESGGLIRQKLMKLTVSFSTFVENKFLLLRIFTLSLFVQILRVTIVICFGTGLGLEIGLNAYFTYVPIITVVTFLPFSIAGIGVRELLFVFFFSRPEIGLENHVCISLSLLYFSMGIVATLPGAIIYIFTGLGKKTVRE